MSRAQRPLGAWLASTTAVLLLATCATAAPVLPTFSTADFQPGDPVDNPYFSLRPGARTVIEGGGESDGEPVTERSVLTVLGLGPEILGVQTTTQRDRAYEDGVLVEDTFDFYAQDKSGNVWYMGEDVTNYRYDDEGNLIGTDSESAWRAGVNNALPGYIMPADLVIGFNYYQEYARGDEALDQGTIFDLGLTLEVGGTTFTDVLKVFETTELDPDAREFKYYAPGVGLVRVEEGLDENLENPEVVTEAVSVSPVPLPATMPLAAGALTALGFLRLARSRGSDRVNASA